jgi:hypothetical protein
MAGDWIKLRVGLPDDPAVVSISNDLGLDQDTVVGKLARLWAWANVQSRNGNAPGVTDSWVDSYVRAPGFAKALAKAGWLIINSDGIRFPKFDRHNSQSAKRRALGKERTDRNRRRKCNARSATKASPEKRREEINPQTPLHPGGNGGRPSPRDPSEREEPDPADGLSAFRRLRAEAKEVPLNGHA